MHFSIIRNNFAIMTVKESFISVEASGMLIKVRGTLHKQSETCNKASGTLNKPSETYNKVNGMLNKPSRTCNKPSEMLIKQSETCNKVV